jgi:hypothetical protein
MDENEKKYTEGHFIGMWMGIGIALFAGIGIPLTLITDNPGLIGIGPALGVGFGLAIGQSIENKYKKEGKIIPKSDNDSKKMNIYVILGLVMLIIGVMMIALYLF